MSLLQNLFIFKYIDLKAVSDWEETITFVESGLPGSHHDQVVFEYSDFGQKMTSTDRIGNYFLLGDNRYVDIIHSLRKYHWKNLSFSFSQVYCLTSVY